MKRMIKYMVLLLIFVGQIEAGEINGRILFDTGNPAEARVAVGQLKNTNRAFLSAMMESDLTGSEIKTDSNGNFSLTNVTEGVPVMIMVEVVGQKGPSFNRTLTLQAGQVLNNYDITVPKFDGEEVRVKGKISINGTPSTEFIAGVVNVYTTDNTITAFAYFGKSGDGEYSFVNLPPGNYKLSADASIPPDGDNPQTVTQDIVVPATGDIEVDLNVTIP